MQRVNTSPESLENSTAQIVDVLIVGAGITGCALAASLKARNFNVLLVERESSVPNRFKGEYMQPFAVQTLNKLGLGSVFSAQNSFPIEELRFRDLNSGNSDVNAEVTVAYPERTSARALTHGHMIKSLRAQIKTLLGESFLTGASLKPLNEDSRDFCDRPEFQITTSEKRCFNVRPKWVIGCDGRGSSVRRWMSGPAAPQNSFVILGASPELIVGAESDIKLFKKTRYEVVRSYGQGTLSVFPVSNEHCRIYWNTKSPARGAAAGATLKETWGNAISQLLQDSNKATHISSGIVNNVVGAPAYTCWFKRPARGAMLLAGDALAITTPFGGQGMTCAMYHVEALTELLQVDSLSEASRASIGKSYADRAKATFAHFNLLNTGLYYLFFSRHPMFKGATRFVLNHWQKSPEDLQKIGALFGGIDNENLELTKVLRLWGIPMPSFFERAVPHVSTQQLVFRLFQSVPGSL